MGIAAEDFDGDCDIDLFVTHLGTETNTLYVNHGGWFADATNQAGLAASSAPFTGFGTAWFDAENDGDLDLFSANGAVRAIPAQRDAGEAFPLRERNQLWLNDGQGRYAEHPGGPAFTGRRSEPRRRVRRLGQRRRHGHRGGQQRCASAPVPQRQRRLALGSASTFGARTTRPSSAPASGWNRSGAYVGASPRTAATPPPATHASSSASARTRPTKPCACNGRIVPRNASARWHRTATTCCAKEPEHGDAAVRRRLCAAAPRVRRAHGLRRAVRCCAIEWRAAAPCRPLAHGACRGGADGGASAGRDGAGERLGALGDALPRPTLARAGEGRLRARLGGSGAAALALSARHRAFGTGRHRWSGGGLPAGRGAAPDDAVARYRLGVALSLLGELDAAQHELEAARRIMPDSALVLAALADLASARGDSAQALDLLQRAWHLEPEAGQLAYKLAMAHRRRGDLDAAREWLARQPENSLAPSINDPLLLEVARTSRSPRFLEAAANWALARGDTEEAASALAEAATLAPHDTALGLRLVGLLGSMGQNGRGARAHAAHPGHREPIGNGVVSARMAPPQRRDRRTPHRSRRRSATRIGVDDGRCPGRRSNARA